MTDAPLPVPGAMPEYPYETLAPGEVREVAPGVHWVRLPLPFALDHINLWMLEDEAGWTLVDTGFNSDTIRDLWRRIFADPGRARPVHRAIVTHFHPDHLGLAGWFEAEYGARLWMTYGEYLQAHLAWSRGITHDLNDWIDFFVENGLAAARGVEIKERLQNFGRMTSPIPVKLRRIWEGEEISIGNHEWVVITGAGHSPEHASLYCAELDVLISGDQILPRITSNISLWHNEPEGDPLRQYLLSLGKFRDLPRDTLVLPSHDRPFYGLHDRLDALVGHHDDRLEEAYNACTAPCTAAEIVPVLFKRELDNHQITFAMGETLAHLNYLMGQGRLERRKDADGLVRFVRAG